MAFDKNRLIADLAPCGRVLEADAAARGYHLDLSVAGSQLAAGARVMLAHGFYLAFITAVPVRPACELVYQFAHFEGLCRLMLRVSAGSDNKVPSIASLYQGAAWHEREVYDFFGITFDGHPHLKHLILTREEKHLNPLLKDDRRLKQRDDIFLMR